MILLIALAAMLLVLLAPHEAQAWGPVTHLIHGATVLTRS